MMASKFQLCTGPHLLLRVYDVLQSVPNMRLAQWRKPEACAAGLQSWDDLADIVADQTEPRIPDVFLHNCKKRVANLTKG